MRGRAAGVAFIVASASGFGGMAIFARIAYDGGADVVAVLFLRFLIAAVCMSVLLRARRLQWPRGRTLLGLAALGGVGYVGQSAAYFTALTYAPASLVALLLYLYPAIVTLLAAALGSTALTKRRVVALVIALTGTALTVGPDLSGRPLGIALALAGAAIYSVYILVGNEITPRVGALQSSTVVMAAAAVVYGGVTLVARPSFPSTGASWIAVVAIALVSTVVAITTFFAGMARLGAADASTLSTIEPVVTVLLAALVLDERLSPVQLAGGVLILGAVVLLTRSPAGGDPSRLSSPRLPGGSDEQPADRLHTG